jgi:hypothetical protein
MEAEFAEDLDCAKRDADVSLRQRRQADWYIINYSLFLCFLAVFCLALR